MNNFVVNNVLRKRAGRSTYYFASVSNDVISQYTKVLVIEPSADNYLEEDIVQGYQRPGSATRQRTIGSYYKNYPDDVVPPSVLNAAGNWIYSPYQDSDDTGSLSLEGPAHVIDGQHRIGGFIHLWRELQIKRDIDLIIYDNLDVDDERAIFHTINDRQIGVPKAIGAYNMLDVDINWIGWELNELAESPFSDKISRVGRLGADKLFNLNSVATNVKRTFDHGSFDETTAKEVRLDFMIRYWSIIQEHFPDEWEDIDKGRPQRQFKLLELTGLIAWSLLAKSILGRSFDPEIRSMDWELVETLVGQVVGLDWKKTGKFAGRTGEGGGRLMLRDMERMVDRDSSVMDSTKSGNIGTSSSSRWNADHLVP